VAQGFAFVVARGRHTGFRTLLAPPFLVEGDQHHVLAGATGTGGAGVDGARIVELDKLAIGPLSVGYTSEAVRRADVEVAGDGDDEQLFDEHGRGLEVVYGVVCRAELLGPLHEQDLRTARGHALARYRRFLSDETGHDVESSVAFELSSSMRERDGGGSDRAGLSSGSPRPSRRREPPGPRGILAAAIVLALCAAGTMLASGGSQPASVTVYSSLPLHGSEAARSAQIVRGIRLALRRARGRAGDVRVRYASLDASRGRDGWNERAVAANARTAAADQRTAVYLGELDSAASAVSIPILSRARIAQISPANTAVGLTTQEPGARGGEPSEHYHDGFRNYARIMPRDSVQGRVLASLVRADGCSRVAILRSQNDGVAASLAAALRAHATRPVLDAVAARASGGPGTLAGAVADRRADCVVVTTRTAAASTIFASLARAPRPAVRLYGSDHLATGSFADAVQRDLPEGAGARLELTLAIPAHDALAVEGLDPTTTPSRAHPSQRAPAPYASFGYESMSLALDAIARSRTTSRRDTVQALFRTRRRRSVLGTYAIDPNGDTTLAAYGVFAIRHGALSLERRIASPG